MTETFISPVGVIDRVNMSEIYGYLSQNPGAHANLASTLDTVFTKKQMKIECMLPAQVISYDRAANEATVKPLIQMKSTTGATLARPNYAKIPVLALGNGDFVINFPLKPGDLGWIEASDRDISLFMQSLSDSAPNTNRLHKFSDARFIPDTFRKYTIAGEDSEAMVIQSVDSSTRIAIFHDKINITTPTEINIKAANKVNIDTPETNITGKLNVAGDTTISANAEITGNLTLGGDISQGGAGVGSGGSSFASHVNLNGGAEISGREFVDHTHPSPAGGNTGPVN